MWTVKGSYSVGDATQRDHEKEQRVRRRSRKDVQEDSWRLYFYHRKIAPVPRLHLVVSLTLVVLQLLLLLPHNTLASVYNGDHYCAGKAQPEHEPIESAKLLSSFSPPQSALKCARDFFLQKRDYFTCQDYSDNMVSSKSIVMGNEIPTEPLHHVDTPFERITFGMGCFWGCDCLYGATRGVLRTRVGYSAGTTENPTYKNIGDHTEVIEIDFDPTVVSLNQLLELFWNNHEYGLGSKIKKQYCSLILYHTEEQRLIAEASLAAETEKRSDEEIATKILPATTFYPAEDYHQKYRLQQHKELTKALKLDSQLLQTSHVAARLNGYLVGVGGMEQFLKEADSLGLTSGMREYVKKELAENEGGSLYC